MGTLVCKHCNATIDHFEDEKVTVLYSKCDCCNSVDKVNRNNEKQFKIFYRVNLKGFQFYQAIFLFKEKTFSDGSYLRGGD